LSAEALPAPEIPVTITSCFAGFFLSGARRDLGDWREGFWGVIGFNATPEIKP